MKKIVSKESNVISIDDYNPVDSKIYAIKNEGNRMFGVIQMASKSINSKRTNWRILDVYNIQSCKNYLTFSKNGESLYYGTLKEFIVCLLELNFEVIEFNDFIEFSKYIVKIHE